MERLLRLMFNVKDLRFRCDDDPIDRLSKRYTVSVLLLFTMVVTTKVYVGDAIRCWCPAQFTDSHKLYANTICWVSNTYYVPFDDQLPLLREPRKVIGYYQWVPIILMVEAVFCYLPSILWSILWRQSGFSVVNVMDAANSGLKTSSTDVRDKTTRYMIHQLDRYLMARTARPKGFLPRLKHIVSKACYARIDGCYLALSYLFVKLVYIANAVAQIYVLDLFLGNRFRLYGIDVLRRFVDGADWSASERFPRVTMCDFNVRHQTVNHRYIVQCVLSINLFNEKIFIVVWFWLAVVAVVTSLDFLKWTWRLFFHRSRVRYLRGLLTSMNALKRHPGDDMAKFTSVYLKRDGLFVIRLLSDNMGDIVAAEVLAGLWDVFCAQRNSQIEDVGDRKTRRRDADGDRTEKKSTEGVDFACRCSRTEEIW